MLRLTLHFTFRTLLYSTDLYTRTHKFRDIEHTSRFARTIFELTFVRWRVFLQDIYATSDLAISLVIKRRQNMADLIRPIDIFLVGVSSSLYGGTVHISMLETKSANEYEH